MIDYEDTEEYEYQKHFKAIMRGVDITRKWYAICCYIESKETEIEIPNIKLKIGTMAWNEEQKLTSIYAHKEDKRIFFTRETDNGNLDIQHQFQNLYIHGEEYIVYIDKTIDTIFEELSKTEIFCEYWGYIHCCFMNGTIKGFV